MLRTIAIALAIAAGTGPATADSRTQLLASVDRELAFFVPNVDAASLSTSQLAAINGVIHGDGSHSHKIGAIRSIIGGRSSLRGLLFGEVGISRKY